MRRTFLRLIGYALNHKKTLTQAGILLVIATIANVTGPYLLKVFIDDHIVKNNFDATPLVALALGYIAAHIIGACAFYSQAIRLNKIALNIVQKLREEAFTQVTHLPMRFFDTTTTGSLLSRITNDTESIKDLYVQVISVFAINTVKIAGILIAMAILDFRLMLICSTLIPLVVALMWLYERLSTPVFHTVRNLLSDINTRLNESIQGMHVIQLLNQQQRFIDYFRTTSTAHYQAKVKNILINGLLLRAMVDFIYLLLLAALLYGFGLIEIENTGAIQVGVIYAFINYLGNITQPLLDMVSKLNLAQQALVSADRLFSLMQEPTYVDGIATGKVSDSKITFAIDSFSYNCEETILEDIHFSVQPGEFIGIVGHTGSGKSTLISLLMNFYEINQGKILLGRQNIKDISNTVRSKTIGLVQQDAFIYSGTISDNIRLDLNISDEAVVQAAKKAQLHDVIMAMPLGYNEPLAERGKKPECWPTPTTQPGKNARTQTRNPGSR